MANIHETPLCQPCRARPHRAILRTAHSTGDTHFADKRTEVQRRQATGHGRTSYSKALAELGFWRSCLTPELRFSARRGGRPARCLPPGGGITPPTPRPLGTAYFSSTTPTYLTYRCLYNSKAIQIVRDARTTGSLWCTWHALLILSPGPPARALTSQVLRRLRAETLRCLRGLNGRLPVSPPEGAKGFGRRSDPPSGLDRGRPSS